MPTRRSDAELLEEFQQKQAAITERMARKADPMIVELQNAATDLEHLIDAAPAIGEDIDKLETARDVLSRLAAERIAAFAERVSK